MRGLMFVCVLLAAGVVGLGFYQGWFHLSTDSADDKSNVTFTMDQDKFKKDEEKAKEKIQDLGHQAKEKTIARTEKAKD
jgi:hypothetical protein